MEENKAKLGYYGELFLQKSKDIRGQEFTSSISDKKKPELYKTYKNAISRISLPKPEFSNEIQFWNTIINRHSARNFSKIPIKVMELSLLLFAMYGLTRKYSNKFALRTVPSAGAIFPIEIYPVINNVIGIKQGIYHYDILNHSLEFLKEGDFRKSFSEACCDQRMVFKSAIGFIFTVVTERIRVKSKISTSFERIYREIFLDCGHIGQDLYLASEALGLNACVIAAFYDDEVNNFLDLNDKEEFAIYIGVVGKKRSK